MADFREWVEVFRLDLGAKLLIAVLAGGAIGLERELRRKPAGLRTNILICLGSALLMDLSMAMAGPYGGDPGRIAAQVVTGIGFLGAGTILHARGTITGLTSAATIWVVAAIGLTAGAGHLFEALAATITVMIVLEGLGYIEKRYLEQRSVDHSDGVPPSEWDARGGGRRAGEGRRSTDAQRDDT
ncbi:MAG: MgtC/SapB family protein [Gemmatimonadaceae bacterium]|nr:MgtC/SapB family protein [Gemmatimonadaceae bacterium]MCW5826106.1 MgtC/SapB family protein [Gemmatimonadaceae bacterium]